MRYQHVLLPALASLAFASDDTISVSDNPAPTPDALPLEDLRDIPVPTFTIATGVTAQDIPYATASAISEVSSQVAATPLSVFPAATDVPINDLGTTDSNTEVDGNPNVISTSNTKLKRDPSGVARQPRKRAACDQEPTIPNYYNVALDSAASFRADAKISAVATTANPAPIGYFQTYNNKQAASSAMNYLGYTVVDTGNGYDVSWCASKCSSKAGCTAFNIYFERDPTLDPGPGCPNPPAFANIKCSFWGTALDETSATNTGQFRYDFEVAIAGSNAYTSYKLGGPVAGWSGPQNLGNAALNAPLWDCTNTWTYLGYKLLQAGSVDPRLCAAACDSQSTYNKAHPAIAADGTAKPVVTCNAFGSYILTKNNATGSYQQGQMCTFYTAYWDAKYATNTASFDGAIGAKYNYTYSAFYGKQGAQPAGCASEFVGASGTYVKGRSLEGCLG
jgi:hypothetical protein